RAKTSPDLGAGYTLRVMDHTRIHDLFAAHVAASLVVRLESAEGIARRAYDVADALVAERTRRGADDERPTLAGVATGAGASDTASPSWLDFERGLRGAQLLDDDVAPPNERDLDPDPRLIDELEHARDYDPRWDALPV